MNLEDIKNLIDEEGGKVVITDGDGPALVIMSYEDYRKMKGSSGPRKEDVRIVERLPIKEEPQAREVRSNSLGIDDLPF
jgi:hypothetical protein